jgi:replication-associated recombination protein RarA
VIYLAMAPKSNAVYKAFNAATKAFHQAGAPAGAPPHRARADQAQGSSSTTVKKLPLRP